LEVEHRVDQLSSAAGALIFAGRQWYQRQIGGVSWSIATADGGVERRAQLAATC
jgi:hypothetical protein